jgi:hypothetical protein
MKCNVLSIQWLASAILTSTLLLGCGDEDTETESSATGTSTSTTDTGATNALEAKLSACPVINMTTDKLAAACLKGTYEGKDLAGNACTLTLGDGGAFDLASATITRSFTPQPDAIFVFGHSVIGGYEQVVLKVSDPLTQDPNVEIDFTAKFGTGVPDVDAKIDYEVAETSMGVKKSILCTVKL